MLKIIAPVLELRIGAPVFLACECWCVCLPRFRNAAGGKLVLSKTFERVGSAAFASKSARLHQQVGAHCYTTWLIQQETVSTEYFFRLQQCGRQCNWRLAMTPRFVLTLAVQTASITTCHAWELVAAEPACMRTSLDTSQQSPCWFSAQLLLRARWLQSMNKSWYPPALITPLLQGERSTVSKSPCCAPAGTRP